MFLGSEFPLLGFVSSLMHFLQFKEDVSHTQSQGHMCFASQGHEKYFKTCLSFAACGGGVSAGLKEGGQP